MTYEPRPNPSGDTLIASRDTIRGNFTIVQDRFEDDHEAYSAGTGRHTLINLVAQTTLPATAAGESWLASSDATSAATTRVELGWRPEGEGASGDLFYLSAMPIRAACYFELITTANPQVLLGRSFNISDVSASGSVLTVTFNNNIPSENYLVIANSATSIGLDRSFTPTTKAVGTLTMRMTVPATGNRFQLLVMGG